jgi:hypothetical protein
MAEFPWQQPFAFDNWRTYENGRRESAAIDSGFGERVRADEGIS